MERRALQVVLTVLGLIPLFGLAIVRSQGPAFFFGDQATTVPNALDNQFRYLAGVYAGAVTGGLWWAIPRWLPAWRSSWASPLCWCSGSDHRAPVIAPSHPRNTRTSPGTRPPAPQPSESRIRSPVAISIGARS
jgi:hypothetical protein